MFNSFGCARDLHQIVDLTSSISSKQQHEMLSEASCCVEQFPIRHKFHSLAVVEGKEL